MQLAIYHDWLTNYGGAERVIETLHSIYPSAPIYTSVFSPHKLPPIFKKMDISTSFLQKIPGATSYYQKLFPLMPLAFEKFCTKKYDVVISSSHSFSKGIITTPATLHICYCYTPTRYFWDFYHLYLRRVGKISRTFGYLITNYLRLWDFCAAQRADEFIAISQTVARRILKYYHRESTVIYPPVNTSFFTPSTELRENHQSTITNPQSYYLVVSRLVPYKKIDIVIAAFRDIPDKKLKIVGDGSEETHLKKLSSPNVSFISSVSDEKLREYYRGCRAVIFPAEEDFGLVPVEAQATGTPVIAYKSGGATETVKEGITGELFYPQTKEAIVDKIKKFENKKYSPEIIREHSLLFDEEIFKEKISKFITEKYERTKKHK